MLVASSLARLFTAYQTDTCYNSYRAPRYMSSMTAVFWRRDAWSKTECGTTVGISFFFWGGGVNLILLSVGRIVVLKRVQRDRLFTRLSLSLWLVITTITVFIARQHTDARYWYSKSVCLSVCPSVRYVPVSDENGLTYRHSFFSPYGSPIILVLPSSNTFTKFRRGHPLRGR